MPLSRGRTVGIIASLGAVVSITTLPTWVSGTTPTATGDLAVAAAGTAAAPGAASVGLVLLAAALVLGLAGQGMRVAGLIGVSLVAVAGAANVIAFLGKPEAPAMTAAVKMTNVRAINTPVDIAIWPYLCLAALVATVIVAVILLIKLGSAGKWGEVGRRYRRDTTTVTPAAGSLAGGSLDASTSTGGSSAGAAAATGTAQTSPQEVPERRPQLQAMDDWDAISRGEDPSSTRLD